MQRGARRRARAWAAVGMLALAGVLTACVPPPPEETAPPTTTTTATTPPKSLVIYGDSLVFEAQQELRTRLDALLPDGWVVVIRSLGGTAQCDFHNSMQDDAVELDVELVVIAFSGNAVTPCMTTAPRAGFSTRVAAYTEDANWAVDFYGARNVPLLFVAGPNVVHLTPATDEVRLVYLAMDDPPQVHVADEAPLFTDPVGGAYERLLPCLEGECTGTVTTILARSADGVHFCLTGTTGNAGCNDYSSGVVRYADPIVQQVATMLGLTAPPPRAMIPTITPIP